MAKYNLDMFALVYLAFSFYKLIIMIFDYQSKIKILKSKTEKINFIYSIILSLIILFVDCTLDWVFSVAMEERHCDN